MPENDQGMKFALGDRVTTDDDAGHGATIIAFDYTQEYATVVFDQHHETPYPPEEIHVDDLRAFREERHG